MIVALAAHSNRDSPEKADKDQLVSITKHVALVRRLLDDAMSDASCGGILQGLLGDINLIARECYNCATHYYKNQDLESTILALTAAFELAESYMEYVMCSTKLTAADVQKAHSELKVDSIASLMAYCLHEEGDIPKSRTYVGHSILYCGDVHDLIPLKSMEKYASAVLGELQNGERDVQNSRVLAQSVKGFVDNLIHAYAARQVPDDQVIKVVHGFRRCFDQTSSKLIEKLRNSSSSSIQADANSAGQSIAGMELCVEIESFLASSVLRFRGMARGAEAHTVLMSICKALSDRKLCYATYYASRDRLNAVSGLIQSHSLLSDAISSLPRKEQSDLIDLGGACGWRGVIAMEVALISSYSKVSSPSIEKLSLADCSEQSAIRDVEDCLRCWGAVKTSDHNVSGCLFDAHRIVLCLEAVCSSLSLISCPFLEKSARKLLETFQSTVVQADRLPIAWPPPSLELLNFHVEDMVEEEGAEDMDVCKSDASIPLFQQIDAEITLGVKYQSVDDLPKTLQHLQNVVEMLKTAKTNGVGGSVSKSTALKAMGMREVLVHLVFSEMHFSQGHGKLAISEAKAALSICWKMSKKFVSSPALGEDYHFELPQGIKQDNSVETAKSSSLIYFQALEFSSWDILHAAKLVLCRIASLYSLLGQPHRYVSNTWSVVYGRCSLTLCFSPCISSQIYYTEAMALVGGLNLRFFQRSPFYEFARLQLHSSHPDQAKAALQLMSSNQKSWAHEENCSPKDAGASRGDHCCIVSDSTFIEQKCNEMIQEGDLQLVEGAAKEALGGYINALKMLESTCKTRLPSKGLRKSRARCYRKIVHLKSNGADLGDAVAVEKLLSIMEKLKRCTEHCANLLERVKCMHALAQANVLLLRSSSSRAFMSTERTVSLLEEALSMGNHLGVSHLSKQLRSCLGMAYLMEMEEKDCSGETRTTCGDQIEFLSWGSAVLISNSSIVEFPGDSTPTEKLPDLELDKRLERFSSRQRMRPSASPRELQQEMVASVAHQVKSLPASWVVVSVGINLSSELVISRILVRDCMITSGIPSVRRTDLHVSDHQNNDKSPVSFCLRGIRWERTMEEITTTIRSSRCDSVNHPCLNVRQE